MEVGRIIGGKYRLTREIGEGAMGSVWAAAHELLGSSVAIKFMRPALEDPHTAAARFVAEAKAAAQLKHRFIVDVFDFGITEDGHYYMVQELLDGRSLGSVLEQGPAWSVQDVLRFAAQCLSGLAAVHASGVVHRDLKPDNIFVLRDAEGRFPKLLDFGISKAASASIERAPGRAQKRASLPSGGRPLTIVGAALGTPAYMSPEQLRNQRDLDGRADLYSLGVVLYEWLSGQLPYQGTSDFAGLAVQIEARTMTPLERLRPDLDAGLCKVIARALEPEASARFPGASAMREALLACVPASRALQSVVQSQPQVRVGRETQVLLESAGDPFADPDEATFLPRFPLARVAGAALGVLVLGGALWLGARSAKPAERAAVAHAPALPAALRAPQPSTITSTSEGTVGLVAAQGQALPVSQPELRDLPSGVDMPEESLPVTLPAELRGERSKAHASTHAQRRERVRAIAASAESAPPDSSAGRDRPIAGKVVRQLDF